MSQLSNNNQITENSSEKPQLCKLCCEFFGNEFMDNLCSKCFKQNNKTNDKNPMKLESTSTDQPVEKLEENYKPIIQSTDVRIEEQKTLFKTEITNPQLSNAADNSKKEQIDPKKCYICPKKTGHLGFQCKCGFTFCKGHRLPEDHECTFNYKEEAAKKLAKENPTVIASKLTKI